MQLQSPRPSHEQDETENVFWSGVQKSEIFQDYIFYYHLTRT